MTSLILGFLLLFWLSANWALVWAGIHLVMVPLLIVGTDTRWGVTILSWCIPNTHLVRTMDYDGEIKHVLAYGEWGQVLHGHVYWFTETGRVQLYPNGYVKATDYVYFWEPTNPEHLVSMHLTYDCEAWDKLALMHWIHRDDYRQRLKRQTKLNHESHIR